MSAMVCNCRRAVWKYIIHLDSFDISANSDSSGSSDSRKEQTSLQYFANICISNGNGLGFSGPWVCAVSALVGNHMGSLLYKRDETS